MRNALVFLAALALLGGCTSRTVMDAAIPLDVAGPVGIDIETIGGDVMIRADPGITAPQVRIARQSTHGHLRKQEALTALEQIEYSVEVVSGEIGPVVRVRSSTTHAEPHFVATKVIVDVPDVVGLWVRMPRGRVEAFNVRGPIDISTSDGDVLVATPQALTDPIRIANQNGDITVRLRGESSGELDFESEGGLVYQRIRQGRTIVHAGSDNDTLLASFNDGDNPVILRTVDGTIRFIVVPDPLSFTAAVFD
jgi:hypothetical protein